MRCLIIWFEDVFVGNVEGGNFWVYIFVEVFDDVVVEFFFCDFEVSIFFCCCLFDEIMEIYIIDYNWLIWDFLILSL